MSFSQTSIRELWIISQAMIKILNEECQGMQDYCDPVGEGVRSPGLLIYPPSVEYA